MSICINNDRHAFYCGDCLEVLKQLPDASIDVAVTSPPYNIGVKYNSYKDTKSDVDYIEWCAKWAEEVKRVLKDSGSFFLNIAGKSSYFSLPLKLVARLSDIFVVQNQIIWVKSVYIAAANHTFGHFKPLNSNRFLNNTHEFVFHFTKNGDVTLDRLSIGVPYSDESNITRWSSAKTLRCGGNVWHIPYETKNVKDLHPAMFPVEIPERCIKLHGISNDLKVMDIFAGMFSTGLAAKKLGVSSVMIEKDEHYFNLGVQRFNG